MKKSIYLIAIVSLLTLAMVTGCAKKEAAPAGEPTVGGYTEDRELTADDLRIFETAMADLDGVGYEPTLVATQVVAGVNYRFTATATPVVPDAEPYTAYVYIYEQLDGTLELTEIVTPDDK